ncbi:hypothetical protein CAP36_10315 [Chitinophagaceae bacterium IBVUCB2]|nr:hypothetical protein CAP36_10315 [Chitinophagaceae bacterium IBVUCB2]
MKEILKKIMLVSAAMVYIQSSYAQNCKTREELDAAPGQYLTAAQHPWPAARADYFINLKTVADKAIAKKTLEQVEKTEQQSRIGFTLTGGNWESTFSSNRYEYAGNTKMGSYYLQTAHYEFFCASGKQKRNSEYGTVLRVYANAIPLNTLNRFIKRTFDDRMGDKNFGFQYADWKNNLNKPGDKLISLFNYLSCNNTSLLEAINTGQNYFQDVAEEDVKMNTRVPHIYRYWFVKKNTTVPMLIPVSRKAYLLSLLEYYEREKLQFVKTITVFTADRDKSGLKQIEEWETAVNEKIDIVKKILATEKEDWLNEQAITNRTEDVYQNSKYKLKEKINYNRFWKFYDGEKKSEPLYQYNPAYFKTSSAGAAAPQFITIAFRYVTMPSSLRLLHNFTNKFDYAAYVKLLH